MCVNEHDKNLAFVFIYHFLRKKVMFYILYMYISIMLYIVSVTII